VSSPWGTARDFRIRSLVSGHVRRATVWFGRSERRSSDGLRPGSRAGGPPATHALPRSREAAGHPPPDLQRPRIRNSAGRRAHVKRSLLCLPLSLQDAQTSEERAELRELGRTRDNDSRRKRSGGRDRAGRRTERDGSMRRVTPSVARRTRPLHSLRDGSRRVAMPGVLTEARSKARRGASKSGSPRSGIPRRHPRNRGLVWTPFAGNVGGGLPHPRPASPHAHGQSRVTFASTCPRPRLASRSGCAWACAPPASARGSRARRPRTRR
jgi:hypothetical protein